LSPFEDARARMDWWREKFSWRTASEGGPYKRNRKPGPPARGQRYVKRRLASALQILFHAVVGGFFGYDYVVDVGFAEACGGDADELAFFG
jgi:hypothetical protein